MGLADPGTRTVSGLFVYVSILVLMDGARRHRCTALNACAYTAVSILVLMDGARRQNWCGLSGIPVPAFQSLF